MNFELCIPCTRLVSYPSNVMPFLVVTVNNFVQERNQL